HTTRYTHDAAGRRTSITDPLGHATRYTHDAAGRLTSVTDPLGHTTEYRYDPAGRLHARHDPTGERHRYGYDRSGRIAEHSVMIGYGAAGIRWSVERDALGRPTRLTRSDTGTVELTWDADDRLVAQQDAAGRVGWAYDADGHRTRLTHPDGTEVDHRYDAAGHLVALHHPLLGEIRLRRDPDGRLLEIADGVASTRLTRTDGRLTAHTGGPRGGEVTTWLAHDHHGRIIVSVDSGGRQQAFGYDAAGQLVSAGDRSFAYDSAGRLRSESGPDGRRTHTYDAAGRLVETRTADGACEYGYDEAGRRVSEVTPRHRRSYTYDPITGQPAATTTGTSRTTGCTYNALGQLSAVDDTALTWDTAHPVPPPLTIGASTVISPAGPWALADRDGPPRHLHPDPQGTPTVGIGPLDPWGAGGSGTAGPHLGYRGELTVDDDLVWLRHRTYHPATRSFLQTDPWPPVAGTAVAANPYHYAGNDPVNAQDPFGLRPVTDNVITRGLDTAGDWLGNHWEYLAGGALVVAGIALTATGVGGAPGIALMMAGGAMISGGSSMVLQKALSGGVDHRRVATDAAIGAVPLGAASRFAGTAVREALHGRQFTRMLEQARGKIPAEWGSGVPNKKGVGLRWTDPANPGNGVRIDRGTVGSSSPSQRPHHVVARSDGQILSPNGTAISGPLKQNPQAHIPLEEWLTWQRWNAP
ncbi:MAG: RHS repeat-associated core domain-containing protein, partial [Pseudonocardia sp.]